MTHPPHRPPPRRPSGVSALLREEATQAVLGVLATPVAVLDADTLQVLAISRGLQARAGVASEDVVGRTVFDGLVPREEQFALQSGLRAAREEGTATARMSLRHRDGGQHPVPWTCHVVGGPPGESQLLVLTLVDDEEPATRAPAAEALEATVLTDLSGCVIAASDGVRSLLGREPGELVGRPFPLGLFDREQLQRRADAAGQAPGLSLLLLDPTRFDRRQDRQVDLGDLDRRGGRRRGHPAGRPDGRPDGRRDERRGGSRPTERTVDWSLVRPDGSTVVAAVRVSELRDGAGEVVGYRATATDVTEERRTHQLLVSAVIRERDAVAKLAELDQIQRDFIGRASHELRTPLASMLGYTEMLFESGDALSPEDRSFVEAIARNAGRLHSLVEDLLVLSRVQALSAETPSGRVDLAAVLGGAGDLVNELTGDRDLQVHVDVPDGPVTVEGDAAQLERILVNLVSNAVKYTRDGGEVGCSVGVEGDAAVIHVSDTGRGMSPSDAEQIFTPFFRTGAVEADRIRGTGLGLAIVKQLVERHRGEISVVSVEDVGSTFSVRLPLAPLGGHDDTVL